MNSSIEECAPIMGSFSHKYAEKSEPILKSKSVSFQTVISANAGIRLSKFSGNPGSGVRRNDKKWPYPVKPRF
jgi:hypothetical protein